MWTGTCVSRCAHFGLWQTVFCMLGIAKVTHLDQGAVAVVQQSVLLQKAEETFGNACEQCLAAQSCDTHQLDISVDDSNLMAVIKGYDELLEEPPGLIFLEPVSLLDILKHVPARRKLHGNAKEFIGQEHLFELYDVGMKKPVMVKQLPLNILCDLQVRNAELPEETSAILAYY